MVMSWKMKSTSIDIVRLKKTWKEIFKRSSNIEFGSCIGF